MESQTNLTSKERALLASSGELPDECADPTIQKDLDKLSQLLQEIEAPQLPRQFREQLLSELDVSKPWPPKLWITRVARFAVAAGIAFVIFIFATKNSAIPRAEITDSKPALNDHPDQKASRKSNASRYSLFTRSSQPEVWEKPQTLLKHLKRIPKRVLFR